LTVIAVPHNNSPATYFFTYARESWIFELNGSEGTSDNRKYRIFFSHGATAYNGPGPPHYRGFTITQNTHHSVGLPWMSDHLSADIHTTLTRDRLPWPGGMRTCNPRKWAAADPRLRQRGHWDQHCRMIGQR
jgi:hypothetical protein